MARGKWWEPDLLQGDRDIDEIKAEFEENGFTNLTQKEIKRFHSYNRKEQKRLMAMPMKEVNQQAIAEQKAIMFIVSGMFFLLGFNLLWGYEKNAGFAMISFAVLLSLGAYAR
jgi:hypothetical protein|tara:strand:+ start:301 stop:639 length:339 start_codon:yes stop_codon:yes gene_type:complete